MWIRSDTEAAGVALSLFVLQRRHVDHVAKADIAFFYFFVGIVDVGDIDDLDVGSNAVFRTEVEVLLRLRDASDERSCNAIPMGGSLHVGRTNTPFAESLALHRARYLVSVPGTTTSCELLGAKAGLPPG